MLWKKMNTDLSKLSELVQEFFRKKKFEVISEKINDEYRITVNPKQFHGIVDRILITITGNPDDFIVKMAATAKSRSLVLFGNLVSLLGLGFLTVKGHQSEEKLRKLEGEFRVFLSEKIWQVSSPAT